MLPSNPYGQADMITQVRGRKEILVYYVVEVRCDTASFCCNNGYCSSETTHMTARFGQKSQPRQPDTPDGTFPKSFAFMSHIHLVENPQKALGNRDWTNLLSVTIVDQSDFFIAS